MNKYYKDAKQHYELTKPIRGRSDDVRPAGKRRRDWERIVKLGDEKYAYRLYNTDCVIYEPNRITIACDKWASPLTAQFIRYYSPFVCVKAKNNLWINASNTGFVGFYPIYKQMFIDVDSEGQLHPRIEPVPVRTVNRKRANELRGRLREFIKYGTTMLKLSDGWITDQFRKEIMTDKFKDFMHRSRNAFPISVKDLANFTTDDPCAPAYMLMMLNNARSYDSRRGTTDTYKLDYRYKPEAFKKAVYKFHDANQPEVYEIINRMPDGEMFDNIVPWNP